MLRFKVPMNWTHSSIIRISKTLQVMGLMLMFCWFAVPATQAAEGIKLSARLVWGTNRDKPSDDKLKAMSPDLKAKFVNIFKWKDYYEISKKTFTFPKHEGKKTRMSPKCEIVMKLLDKDTLQVQVIGEDQLQRTVKHPLNPILKKGDLFVVGGDDKDSYGDAWFLVIAHPDLGKEPKKDK